MTSLNPNYVGVNKSVNPSSSYFETFIDTNTHKECLNIGY